jgi:hypothetical protein
LLQAWLESLIVALPVQVHLLLCPSAALLHPRLLLPLHLLLLLLPLHLLLLVVGPE